MRSLTVFKALIAACGLSLLAPLAVAQTAPAPAAGTVRDEPVLDRNTSAWNTSSTRTPAAA